MVLAAKIATDIPEITFDIRIYEDYKVVGVVMTTFAFMHRTHFDHILHLTVTVLSPFLHPIASLSVPEFSQCIDIVHFLCSFDGYQD